MLPFHIGKGKTDSKDKRRRYVPREIHIRSANKTKAVSTPPAIKSQFLIPTRYSLKIVKPFLQAVRNDYADDSYMNCLAHIERIKSYDEYPMTFTVPYNGHYTPFTRDTLTLKIIQRCLLLNQRFRWAMKRLIYRWRVSKCRPMNEEDVVTGEIPEKLVEIYDWPQKCRYVFEAATVYRDYLTKIQNASGLFVIPRVPRNPFTNVELTYGQLHFLIAALIRHGYNHWSFDAIKKCDYSMDIFREVYAYPLKYDNLKSVFKKPAEADCVDIVYDFISDEYYYHNIEQPYKYGWDLALKERPDLEIIQAWRALALEQQMLVIRYEGDMLQVKLAPIHKKSLGLIAKPLTDIRRIYNKWLNGLPKKTGASTYGLNNYVIENIVFPNYIIGYYEAPATATTADESDGADSN